MIESKDDFILYFGNVCNGDFSNCVIFVFLDIVKLTIIWLM